MIKEMAHLSTYYLNKLFILSFIKINININISYVMVH